MARRRNHQPVKAAKPALKSMMVPAATPKVTAMHEAAFHGERQHEMWGGRVMVGPRTEALSLPTLRRRSRLEEQSNPIASRTVDIIVSSVVGSGIKPVILDEDLAALWDDWEPEMDAEGIAVNFTGYQRLSVAEIVVAGEVLGILRPRFASDGLAVPLQVQLVPSEHLPVKDVNLPATASCGIEFDAIGRQKTYWLYDLNPTEARNLGKSPTLRPVPGGSVVHSYFARRGGQIRGMPMMASALLPNAGEPRAVDCDQPFRGRVERRLDLPVGDPVRAVMHGVLLAGRRRYWPCRSPKKQISHGPVASLSCGARSATSRASGYAAAAMRRRLCSANTPAMKQKRHDRASRGRSGSTIDGDTIEIHGRRIRFDGIDAPETSQVCARGGVKERCGQASAWYLDGLIGGGTVRCETHDVDRYGRDIATCWLGARNLNQAMVEAG